MSREGGVDRIAGEEDLESWREGNGASHMGTGLSFGVGGG